MLCRSTTITNTSLYLACWSIKHNDNSLSFLSDLPKKEKPQLTLTVLVTTIDAQWEGMEDVGSARYEPALLPPYPTIRALSYSN